MPITQSAKKALRQSMKRRAANNIKKDSYKAAIKEFRKAIDAGNFDDATKLLSALYQELDKAAKTNVIKKNKASRLKSRLSKKMPRGK